MSHLVATRSHAFATILEKPRALLAPLGRAVSAIRTEIKVRRAMRELAELDERMLLDIGLMRDSVEDAIRRGRRRQ